MEGRADAKMISPKAPPAQLKRKQSLAHLAIGEKKKRGLRASSQKFRQDQDRKTRPRPSVKSKVVQIDTAVEALGLGVVLKESPLTTH